MKIIFEHHDRKTIILGQDYETIINKIRSLFPAENNSTILFFDHELNDFFDFTSFDQIEDQPNGIKMIFKSKKLTNVADDISSRVPLKNAENKTENSAAKVIHPIRNRKKKKRKMM